MSFRISIPEPCGENWNAMTPTSAGRYCSVCAHEVPDLSRTPDEELADMALRNAIPKCARFEKGQLDRAIAPHANPVKRLQALVLAAAVITAPVVAAERDSTKTDADTVAKKKTERRVKKKARKKLEVPLLQYEFPKIDFQFDERYVLGGGFGRPLDPEWALWPPNEVPVRCDGPIPVEGTSHLDTYPFDQLAGIPTVQSGTQEDPKKGEDPHPHLALFAVFFRHQRLGQALRKLRASVFGKRIRS